MPRVDFHVLSASESPLRFACDMAARVREEDMILHIHAGSREDAVALDSLLWTFRDISFLPHALADDRAAETVPITVGWPGVMPRTKQALINLSEDIPEFAGDFERVIEPVPAAPELRDQSRQRFRRYREQGWELFTHEPEQDHGGQ
ncbi:MAG: DNA polymerase III subunit chi [Gammaproteobacteria bacterium]|nr:DNA polymerase III subunit chi [Gammaproteobacteria bacterium]